jgi:hypothetical protein
MYTTSLILSSMLYKQHTSLSSARKLTNKNCLYRDPKIVATSQRFSRAPTDSPLAPLVEVCNSPLPLVNSMVTNSSIICHLQLSVPRVCTP